MSLEFSLVSQADAQGNTGRLEDLRLSIVVKQPVQKLAVSKLTLILTLLALVELYF